MVSPIASTLLKVPWTVFWNKLFTPRPIPLPPYNGLTSNPFAGSITKSLNPDPIFVKRVVGFPKIAMLPIIGKTVETIFCLYTSKTVDKNSPISLHENEVNSIPSVLTAAWLRLANVFPTCPPNSPTFLKLSLHSKGWISAFLK